MKEKLGFVALIILLLSISLSGCDTISGFINPQLGPEISVGEGTTVCLVTDTQGIDDRSFNATAWKGVQDAENAFSVVGVFLESLDDTYYDLNISTFIEGGCELIVSVGFLIGDATAKAAEAEPEQLFAIVDFDFLDFSADPPADVIYPNVKELTFRTDQAAFLAGYVAAAATQTGKVGTYGGVKIPTVTIFMDGFALGVQHYNQVHGTDVVVVGWDPVLQIGQFTDTFDDVMAGVAKAEALIAEGVDIIMPVAGGVGRGSAQVAQELGNVYIIGVDTDWTESSYEYADVILTSVLKNMDVAVYDTVEDVLNDSFEGGLYIGTLENNGVGLAPFHSLASLVPAEVVTELEQLNVDIIEGRIATQP
jgi:basic membrane protein A